MFTIICERCGYENSIHEVRCRRCATTLEDSSNNTDIREFSDQYIATQGSTNQPFVVGLIGSTIMFIGVFTPIFSMPFLGNMNYFQNGSGDGVVVLALALVSVVLILSGRYRGLLATGGLSLAMLIFTFVSFQYRISQARSALQKEVGGGLFGGLGEALMGSVQLQWGWAVLIIGSIVVVAAGLMKREPSVNTSSGLMRSISDFLEDTKVLAGFISLIVVITFGIIALNLASGSQTIQKATNTVKETVFPDASVTAMQKALRVEFVGKEYVKADYERGTYMDSVTVNFRFTNSGAKDITGFKGEAVFTDMFDDPIKSTNLSYDNETIKAGQTKNWSGSLDYNEFIASDKKLRDVRPDKMKFAFKPVSIHFSDGTKLETAAK